MAASSRARLGLAALVILLALAAAFGWRTWKADGRGFDPRCPAEGAQSAAYKEEPVAGSTDKLAQCQIEFGPGHWTPVTDAGSNRPNCLSPSQEPGWLQAPARGDDPRICKVYRELGPVKK